MLSPAELDIVESAGLLPRCAFPPPGTSVVLGVSGGADSVAMLALALAHGLDVRVGHVDHGLRPTSGADAVAVVALATRWGVPAVVHRVHVEAGPNLEARARRARYDALPPGVLVAHTADDLAETVLLNMLRGAALDGLAPLVRRRAGAPARPLLGLRRSETVALCGELGVRPVLDEMNNDPRHRRVRVRHEVLPLLDAVAERDVVAVLARQAGCLAEDAELLDQLAAGVDPTDAAALAVAPAALASRAVRRWLAHEGVTAGSVASQAMVGRVLAVARGECVGTELVGGWQVRRTAQRLRLERR